MVKVVFLRMSKLPDMEGERLLAVCVLRWFTPMQLHGLAKSLVWGTFATLKDPRHAKR